MIPVRHLNYRLIDRVKEFIDDLRREGYTDGQIAVALGFHSPLPVYAAPETCKLYELGRQWSNAVNINTDMDNAMEEATFGGIDP